MSRFHSTYLAGLLSAFVASNASAATVFDPETRIVVEGRYDDDALLRTTPGGAGQVMSKISPQFGLRIADETDSVTGRYTPDFLVRHGSGNATLDHRGELLTRNLLTRRLTLDSRMQVWRVSDPTSLPRLGMARTLSPILYGRGEVIGRLEVTERANFRLGYRGEGARIYEGNRPPGWMHSPFGELMYRITRRADVGAMYRLQLFVFGNELDTGHGAFGLFRYRLGRHTVFTARGGPIRLVREAQAAWVPHYNLELAYEAHRFEFAVMAGHDLVGASGFTSTIWADYATMAAAVPLGGSVRIFGAASYFRNGRAPGSGFPIAQRDETTADGYALGTGLEWRLNRAWTLTGTFDRIAQVGSLDRGGEAAAARNIAALRLGFTVF